jgi:Tfp pilus assembly protein PilF
LAAIAPRIGLHYKTPMPVGPEAQLHFQRGNAAFKQKTYGEAVAQFTHAIDIAPDFGKAFFNRAQAHRRLGDLDAALADYRQGLSLETQDAAAQFAFGEFLVALRRPQEALEPLQRAATLRPDWPHAHVRLALTLRMLRRPLDAIAAFDRALVLNPGDAETLAQKATCELMAGRYEAGWRSYEARVDFATHFQRVGFSQPLWLGESDIAGKTILVHAEQGLGDTLQFCRYVPMLERAGARVLFAPQPPLKALMRSLSPTAQIVDVDDPGLQFDVHCRLLSLPLAFGTTAQTIPAQTPYLAAESDRTALWKQHLGSHGFKIGVCWQGSVQGQRLGRSFSPAALAGIGAIDGVRLIGLQRGADSEQPALAAAAGIEMAGDYFASGEEDFLDAAAIIQNCDLVITADTSILHLAGALGRPVWAPLNANADWRWGTEGADSPWYPSLRLFRTGRFDDLSEAFAEMERVLWGTLSPTT